MKKFTKEQAIEAATKLNISFANFTVDDLLEGMNVEGEHSDLPHFDFEMAAQISLAHLKEKADFYKLLKECVEKNNASQYPKIYYAKHMHDGVVGYNDETIYIGTDAIKKMMPSFDGKPVYVLHDERSEKERLETLNETADGYVTETFYNEADGWVWSKIMVISDKAHKAIKDGWAVSNAYIPTAFDAGGTRFNVPYDREFLDGQFTHLAIVPNPRYEDAQILSPEAFKLYQGEKRQQLVELKNSKTQKKGIIMKFWKMTKEEVSTPDAESLVEITNDKGEKIEISVQEMINAVVKQTKQEQKIKVGNKEMTLTELVNSYQTLNAKKNEDEEDEEEEKENKCNEDEDEEGKSEEKENEDDEDEMKEKEKENAKFFQELQNADRKARPSVKIASPMGKVARGKSMYGSAQ